MGQQQQQRRRRRGLRPLIRVLAVAGLISASAAGLAGCVTGAAAAPSVRLASAYVPVPRTPGTTVAYLVIRNNGPADRLVSARTSAGGKVTFRGPAGPDAISMRTVPAIAIPGHSTVAMRPDGYHLLITGAGTMHGGKDVTLTLVFAHAGAVSVVATVTNPETGGSTYFLN